MGYNSTKKFKPNLNLVSPDAKDNAAGGSSLAATEDKTEMNQAAPTDEGNTATTDKGTSLKTSMDDAYSKLDSYGSFSFSKQKEQDDLYKKYIDRNFSYDINSDELYNMYKDRYTEQARLASEDAMGRAAALSGGYGNSYAQSVGAQAYQKVLEGLDDKGLELYQMAWDRYNQEGQDIASKITALDAQKADEQELWKEGYDKRVDEYDLAYDNYQKYIDDKAAAEQAEADWYAANTWTPTGVIDPDTGVYTYENKKGDRKTYGSGINPHTGTSNPDTQNDIDRKYIDRSYQPDNINGQWLDFAEAYTWATGQKERVMMTRDKYWVWDDKENQYVELDPDDDIAGTLKPLNEHARSGKG